MACEPEFEHYSGLFAHWNKNANFASDFDVWFLNLFPHTEPFKYNGGGYQTLNFIPSLATMIFGLLAGRLMIGPVSPTGKVCACCWPASSRWRLAGCWECMSAPSSNGFGLPPGRSSAPGWTCLMLAAFYSVIDLAGWRRWAFPLMVVGANSIAMYMLAETLHHFIQGTIVTHLDSPFKAVLGYGHLRGHLWPDRAIRLGARGAVDRVLLDVAEADLYQDLISESVSLRVQSCPSLAFGQFVHQCVIFG